jgi:hypothetical protein
MNGFAANPNPTQRPNGAGAERPQKGMVAQRLGQYPLRGHFFSAWRLQSPRTYGEILTPPSVSLIMHQMNSPQDHGIGTQISEEQ